MNGLEGIPGIELRRVVGGELLEQYHALRTHSFRTDHDMVGHFNEGQPDAFDLISEHLVAVWKGACVGGVRLTSRPAGTRWPLPTEGDDFCWENAFPDSGLSWRGYGEVHRFVVHPDFRNGSVSRALLGFAHHRSGELGLSYLFSAARPARARLYQKVGRSLGIAVEIRPDVVIPRYKDQRMTTLVIHIGHGERDCRESRAPLREESDEVYTYA